MVSGLALPQPASASSKAGISSGYSTPSATIFRPNDLASAMMPQLGGVCLNVGCIPSKALLHVAAVIDEVSHMAALGVDFGAPKVNVDTLRGHRIKGAWLELNSRIHNS